MALVFAVSHLPQDSFPALDLGSSDKILHAIEYFPLGLLWTQIIRGSVRRRFLLGWLGASLFGLTDEIHQAFVAGRHPDGLDWVADTVGAGIGALLMALTVRFKKKFA
jgi:VanZ family protein